MTYKHNKKTYVKQSMRLAGVLAGLALLVGVTNINLYSKSTSSAKGGGGTAGTGTVVDTSICNTPDSVANFKQVMSAGTVKSKVNPEFVVTGSNLCAVAFNARFVSVTRAYDYDFNTNTYTLSNLPGYPRTEVTKAISIKPGAMNVRFKLNEFPVVGIVQMQTVMTMYHESSFNANGTLKADAVALATDDSRWTQTDAVTF